jgi:glycolate oxidase FAD binding subunit
VTSTVDAPVLEPADLGEAVEAVRGTGALLFRGAGTKLDWGAPAERVERIVSSARLGALLRHDPGDLTAVVQPGMPLVTLQEALAGHGQRVALDPPHPGATVGGTFVANDHGPLRQRYGTLRDLVIGTTVVLADGTVSRSGGRVIKNVAGYDLAKLWCGSLGTLGFVTELVVRCHPLPETSGTLRLEADEARATDVVRAALAAPVEPVALDWDGSALVARFEGRAPAVSAQRDAFSALARDAGAPASGDWLDASDEAAQWDAVAAALRGDEGETTARAATLPAGLSAAVAALRAAAHEAGVEARVHSHAGLGLHTARLAGGDASAHAAAVAGWRRRLGEGGHVVVRRRAPGLTASEAVWGPATPATALMRRVKAQLDPERRCAPGRFLGGI